MSATAVAAARVRAHETSRGDRLFEDPYAAAFAAAVPASSGDDDPNRAALRRALAFQVVVRTRFYDDYLLAAVTACPQVVLVAAGLDTRAYRLTWPSDLRLFELDVAEVLDFKETVLAERGGAPRCERRLVPVDLRLDWPAALAAAGFDRSQPTAWLAEGFLVYLDAPDAERVLAGITDASALGSRLALERGAAASALREAGGPDGVTSLWRGGLADPGEWLAEHGWEVTSHDLGEVAASYGRGAGAPSRSGFLTATRRASLKGVAAGLSPGRG